MPVVIPAFRRHSGGLDTPWILASRGWQKPESRIFGPCRICRLLDPGLRRGDGGGRGDGWGRGDSGGAKVGGGATVGDGNDDGVLPAPTDSVIAAAIAPLNCGLIFLLSARQSTMQNQIKLVSEIPKAPQEVSLFAAVGLIPKIAGLATKQSDIDRLRIADPFVRVYALGRLCESGERLSDELLSIAVPILPYSAYLRQAITPALIKLFRFDLLEKMLELEKTEAVKAQDMLPQLLAARMNNDYAAQLALHEKLYLQTGQIIHIAEAATVSRERLAWQMAWTPALRVIMTRTSGMEAALLSALEMLRRADAQDEFAVLATVIHPMDGNKFARTYALAQRLYWKEDYRTCLEFLDTSKALELTGDSSPLLPSLAAKCAEEMGDYRLAAKWYDKQNKTQADKIYVAADYLKSLEQHAALPLAKLPADTQNKYFIMTGFPRSGTTLLENTLHAHPLIATCEETSALVGTMRAAYGLRLEEDPEAKNVDLRAVLHRKLYYESLDRFVTKTDARVVIDKTPIISSDIKYLEKLFPTKRYIFSIRHPYDVVLSNWKQSYSQNSAMAAFNDMHDACVLYDYTMRNWFEVFPGETERVHYVRYDELVNDFQRVVSGALTFLGVEWTDEVLKFAEHSAQRSVRTPSYVNVRKGLTIGVQTSWQNFEFLFDDTCRALLDPWVKHFGYQE